MIVVTLPLVTVSESNRRDHWTVRARRSRDNRTVARVMFARARFDATGQIYLGCDAVVTLIRISPRELDDDNLRPALKAVRDGIADALQIDDRDPRVKWRYDQRKGPVQAVEVRMEEAE